MGARIGSAGGVGVAVQGDERGVPRVGSLVVRAGWRDGSVGSLVGAALAVGDGHAAAEGIGVAIVERMTIQRMEHVGIVVDVTTVSAQFTASLRTASS